VPWTATSVADTVGALMPEPVIVIDESNIGGLAQAGAGAAAHDWLTATGGAISYAIAALGARDHRPRPHGTRPP
jgi:acetolactate synthase I/II/III large subunit